MTLTDEQSIIDVQAITSETSTALAPAEKQVVRQMASPFDITPAEFRTSLERRGANRKVLIEWLRDLLVDGTDFGKIHVVSKSKCPQYARDGRCNNTSHWSKDSLWKSGAEKICGYLGVTAIFPNIKMYEQLAVQGQLIKTIILRCELYNNQGSLVGEGTGARVLSQDAKYNETDINKSLKMAQKSAHIDATLRMAGLSEIFTQDLEPNDYDLEPNGNSKRQKSVHQKTPWHVSLWSFASQHGLNDTEWTAMRQDVGIDDYNKASSDQQQRMRDMVNGWIADQEMIRTINDVEPKEPNKNNKQIFVTETENQTGNKK